VKPVRESFLVTWIRRLVGKAVSIKDRLQEYALVAEIIGAVAIVASLIFVGLQIQQGTSITKAASYQDFVEELNDWRSLLLTDPELRRLFVKSQRQEGLSDLEAEEQLALGMLYGNLFSIIESAYFSREYGLIGNAEWERIRTGLCDNFAITRRNQIDILYLSDQFRAYMHDDC
jgi:hypothetical protein